MKIENMVEKYQEWLDWFIMDNKLDIQETLYEGEVDGETVTVTLEQFLQKSLEMVGWQEDIKRFAMRAQYVGEDVLEKLSEMCEQKVQKGFFN